MSKCVYWTAANEREKRVGRGMRNWKEREQTSTLSEWKQGCDKEEMLTYAKLRWRFWVLYSSDELVKYYHLTWIALD